MYIWGIRYRRGLAVFIIAFFLMTALSASIINGSGQNSQSSPVATHVHESNIVHEHVDIPCKVTALDALPFDPREQFFATVSDYLFPLPEAPIFLLDPPPEAA